MADTLPSLRLTSDGAMKLLNAAMAKAKEMGVPQCISIVDSGGHLLAFGRMDGAFSQSIDTSLMKAMTAASYGIPTGDIAAGIDLKLAIATQGKRINLPGGLPIIVDGHVIGGIGVGSGTGEQDKQVANAALGALSGARTIWVATRRRAVPAQLRPAQRALAPVRAAARHHDRDNRTPRPAPGHRRSSARIAACAGRIACRWRPMPAWRAGCVCRHPLRRPDSSAAISGPISE